MIQRKQSLYLFIIAILAFLLLFGNLKYATFNNNEEKKSTELRYATTVLKTDISEHSVSKWINILVLGFVGTASFWTIFLFRKKELQKKLCIYLTLLEALLFIIMILDFNTTRNQFPNSDTYPGLWSVFPLVMVVLSFLSWRGIRKDEALLKSMDRIR